jgi:glycosyltransferase involved in cell wall biosynthesis
MKVIVSHNIPFYLAHGGLQTLIQALMKELTLLGVDVQPERWWDPDQTGDILHYFGRPMNVGLAKQKGLKTVMTETFDLVASESNLRIRKRIIFTRMASKYLPGYAERVSFYRDLDALVYIVPHELDVVRRIYDVPDQRGLIIPHGLEPETIKALSEVEIEGDYLVSVGTICPRKNAVLLATCAKEARVPIKFLGKPFSEQDPYFLQFRELIDDKYVRYVGYVSEHVKHKILRGARGFVLLSQGESGCIAVYEAAAAGLPLLLSDLPWAINAYPTSNQLHFVLLDDPRRIVHALRSFYGIAHREQTMTFHVGTWSDIAKQYLKLYQSLLPDLNPA